MTVAGEPFPQTPQDGDAIAIVLAPAVVPELHLIGIGTNHRDRLEPGGIERQKAVVVLKQDDGFLCDPLSQIHVFGAASDPRQRGDVGIRPPIEQPRCKLRVEDAPRCFVDCGQGYLFLAHQPGQVLEAAWTWGFQINASQERLSSSLGIIRRDMMQPGIEINPAPI